jgi:transglutaminase-like putative cysteine protease
VRNIFALLLPGACCLLLALPAQAQFDVGTPAASAKGPKLGESLTKKMKIGVSVTAVGGTCRGIVSTVPVPTDWPEQKVTILDEDLSPSIHKVSYRTIDGGAKQMVVTMPELRSGEEAHAYVTFEFTRYSLLPPEDTTIYKEAPKDKIPKEAVGFLSPSPYIESTNSKIIQFAKEITEGKSDWDKVEAIYDAVREKVEYKNGPLKGALKALTEGTGDCEELTSLFIAACRATGIPARSVWVPEHCYPEFYLLDDEGNGHWFPCQAAGTRALGGIPEHRPILQKGDNFKDPDRPRERLRYVSEFLRGATTKGGGRPQVQFVREMNE